MLLIDGEQTTRIFRLSHSVLGLSLSLRLDTSVTDLAHYWASLTVPAHPVCGFALVLGHLCPHSELLFLFHHFLVGGTGFCLSLCR